MVRREKGITPNTKPARITSSPRLKELNTTKLSAKEAREYAESIINAVREPLIVLDRDLRVVSASRSFYEVFKVKLEDTVGQLIYDLGNKQWNIPKLRELLETVLPQKAIFDDYEVDHDFTTIGRRIMLLNARRIPGPPENLKVILLAIEDITERKKIAEAAQKLAEKHSLAIEKALVISEETLRLVMDPLHVGIALTDLKGTILNVNKALILLYGSHSQDEVLGKNILEFVEKIDHTRALGKMSKVAAEEEFKDVEFTLLRADGSKFQAELSASIIKDAAGVHQGIIVLVRDTTERKELLEHTIAQDRLASIGQLVSGVAHEINNPLTSIIGFSELLLQRALPDDIKDDVKIINDEAHRTELIVKGLLSFARKQPEGKTFVQVNENIQAVLALGKHQRHVNNIQMNTNLANNLPEVTGNASQLQQVFLNLITNAEQAMLEAHKKGTLTITTKRMGDTVKARITDDGPGISPENMKKLFTPFFTTKEVGKGTGLGLSICHGIITEHGGKIYAESELGKGATFVVELPICKTPI